VFTLWLFATELITLLIRPINVLGALQL